MFDIFIIGGGHAGVEAAWITQQFGLKVGIGTIENVPLASTPCNPAVGGVGKGQVVREIDALGGLIGKLADLSGIQFRTLNESKGYAVHSSRVQVDKDLYSINAEKIIEESNIEVIRKKVQFIKKEEEVFLISFENGDEIKSKKVIITTGTFLGGVLHTGKEKSDGGRFSCDSSNGLNNLFSAVKTLPLRFKTGTPARLYKDSIDYSKLEIQKSDPTTKSFHWDHSPYHRELPQLDCYLTRTNEKTLDIIRENINKSPVFNGQIKAVGPRYCPSIEDKAYRYPERNGHHVFIEPEGIEADTVYPNGVSSSLPEEIQDEFLKCIPGLEKAKVKVYGYAVEYDVVDTTELNLGLEYESIKGLYFAGQVNGTSGYEEAAGQGLIAGINAAFSLKGRDLFILDRNESYIGVMIEDLISSKRDEPYRLFTARAESRLFIREDNTIERISPYRKILELNQEIDSYQREFLREYNILRKLCENYSYSANDKEKKRFQECGYQGLPENIKLSDLLKRSFLDPVKTLKNELIYFGAKFREEIVRSVAIGLKYEGYIKRSDKENERILRLGRKRINWQKIVEIKNISTECRQRITELRPETFGQIQRMDGIRPATLAYIAGNIL